MNRNKVWMAVGLASLVVGLLLFGATTALFIEGNQEAASLLGVFTSVAGLLLLLSIVGYSSGGGK